MGSVAFARFINSDIGFFMMLARPDPKPWPLVTSSINRSRIAMQLSTRSSGTVFAFSICQRYASRRYRFATMPLTRTVSSMDEGINLSISCACCCREKTMPVPRVEDKPLLSSPAEGVRRVLLCGRCGESRGDCRRRCGGARAEPLCSYRTECSRRLRCLQAQCKRPATVLIRTLRATEVDIVHERALEQSACVEEAKSGRPNTSSKGYGEFSSVRRTVRCRLVFCERFTRPQTVGGGGLDK